MSHSTLYNIADFLEPVNKYEISEDEAYHQTQLGQHIDLYDEHFPILKRLMWC